MKINCSRPKLPSMEKIISVSKDSVPGEYGRPSELIYCMTTEFGTKIVVGSTALAGAVPCVGYFIRMARDSNPNPNARYCVWAPLKTKTR
jgi:hypothetical protein